MKKLLTVLTWALMAWLILWCVLSIYLVARAEEPELIPVKITGYNLRGTTASGIETQPGICAYRKEDIGKIARIYNADKELIGEYLIADTGKKGGAIRRGEVVDIWQETRAACFAITQNGFIQVVEQEGGEND